MFIEISRIPSNKFPILPRHLDIFHVETKLLFCAMQA